MDFGLVEAAAGCIVIVASLFLATLALIRDFRKRPWRKIAYPACRRCGYNLTGNASGRCPECDAPV